MKPRKLTVDGKDYSFVIGKDKTKVREVGTNEQQLFDNNQIGNELVGVRNLSGYFDECEPSRSSDPMFVVTPKNIADAIQQNPVRQMICEYHNYSSPFVMIDPFSAEIWDKQIILGYCPDCYQNSALSI